MKITLALIATVMAAGFVSAYQQLPARDASDTPTVGTSSISGVVSDDQERPQPVRRAVVTLAGDGLRPSRGAITDDEGRFRIERLPPGDFGLTVTRAGYVTSMYGAKRPGRPGTPILVPANGQVSGLGVRIWRGAVISGTVRDDQGRLLADIVVRAIPVKTGSGSLLSLTNNGVKTGENGEYRIFGLEPGRYVVSAVSTTGTVPLLTLRDAEVDGIFESVRRLSSGRPADARPQTPAQAEPSIYAPMYYPGTASLAQASAIALAAGQEMAGIDIPLRQIRSGVLSGTVMRADGTPGAGGMVQVIELVESTDPTIARILNAPVAPNGTFRLWPVTPGTYRIVARVAARPEPPSPVPGGLVSPVPLAPQLWAESTVTVAGTDVSGVNLVVGPGLTINGRVVFDSSTLKAPTAAMRVWLAPASTRQLAAGSAIQDLALVIPTTVSADGTFVVPSAPPGRFRLMPSGPALDKSPWCPLSAMMAGRDLLDGDFDISGPGTADLVITFTDRRSRIEGTLQTATGQPASDVFVIAFPADLRQWLPYSRRIKAVRPGIAGTFVIADLPPGDYLLTAVTDVDEGDWDVPGFLDQLVPGAVKVPVALGQTARQDLKIRGDTSINRGGRCIETARGEAMVERWRDSWFEECTRVFYMLPASTVDAVLPLTIAPAPNAIFNNYLTKYGNCQ